MSLRSPGGGTAIGGGVGGASNNSVLFVNPAGVLAQDNPNFTYTSGTLAAPTINATTAFIAPAGAAGTPAFFFSADTTTGWYRRSANQWTFSNQGTGTFEFNTNQFSVISTAFFGFLSGAISTGVDTTIQRAAANSVKFGTSTATTTARTELNSAIAGIADNVATSVLTITIPNAAHSGSLRVRVTGSAGAGGAIGANEATAENEYIISLSRTAGVNAVATISAAYGSAASTVAGGNAITCVAAMSAVSGAVGATNTFTVNATIARAAGTATNHTCLVYAQLMNANATGITIA